MAKRGRKPKPYITAENKSIEGLRRDKKSKRFYPVGKGSPNFGTDEVKALHKFRIYQAQQEQQPQPTILVEIEAPNSKIEHDLVASIPGAMRQSYSPTSRRYVDIATDLETLKNSWRKEMRDLIYTNPPKAAIELDCEPIALLANVDDLEPPHPPKALQELLDTYLDDKTITGDEATSSKTWWKEFRSITKAKVVTDLDRQAFKAYRKTITNRKGKRSNVWVRSRFGKIKTIVNHALIEMELGDKEKRILSDVALLKKPPKPAPRPVDISVKGMEAILKDADKWDTALILLALNAAYTNIDCSRLTWDMINFEDGTIRFDRIKSEKLANAPLPRICSLWNRTIDALKAIKNGHKHVFVSKRGTPPHRNTITKHFAKRCVKAGVNDRTFKHLRKSSITAASNDPTVPDRQIDLLAGHSGHIKENYVVKKNVKLACDAVERYYFGS